MIKTRKEVLVELHDKTLAILIDSEVQIAYLKLQDPKMIVRRIEVKKLNQLTRKMESKTAEFTAEMIVKSEEGKLAENREVLKIILEKIKQENGTKKETRASPSGPTG